MLSREDFYMIKQMRQQGAYIVDIAAQIGCSERTVRRYLKYPEPPARKTRHKMVKLKPFMDYIDMRLAENVWNSEVIFAEIKAMGVSGSPEPYCYLLRGQINFPGQQIAYPVCRPVLDMFNDVTQPLFWLHIVQTACADQRVQHRRMFTTAVGTREHPVFPAYGHSP